jgi:hypothetical protein
MRRVSGPNSNPSSHGSAYWTGNIHSHGKYIASVPTPSSTPFGKATIYSYTVRMCNPWEWMFPVQYDPVRGLRAAQDAVVIEFDLHVIAGADHGRQHLPAEELHRILQASRLRQAWSGQVHRQRADAVLDTVRQGDDLQLHGADDGVGTLAMYLSRPSLPKAAGLSSVWTLRSPSGLLMIRYVVCGQRRTR